MSERVRQINYEEIVTTQRISDPRRPHPELSGVALEAPIHGKENNWESAAIKLNSQELVNEVMISL